MLSFYEIERRIIMLKKTINYVDYDGNKREEEFYFNISKAELTDMQYSVNGGLNKELELAVQNMNGPRIMEFFKDLIFKAYGVKSLDGKRFEKSYEISKAFIETEAYVNLFMELVTDETAAIAFLKGVLPQDLQDTND